MAIRALRRTERTREAKTRTVSTKERIAREGSSQNEQSVQKRGSHEKDPLTSAEQPAHKNWTTCAEGHSQHL
jgi:hypothetical protein